ncbi:hypothetical protein EWB00_003891 [Schistosoma japonicum]|uniref:CCDC66 domain-containing protein n=2 Tax=Schistosoma japonicum TaxID=6182 RepID=A0A4Z2D6Y6_SCHJA|nr:hypothetical protein EWB00_003891 [Schistosoma japonicum]
MKKNFKVSSKRILFNANGGNVRQEVKRSKTPTFISTISQKQLKEIQDYLEYQKTAEQRTYENGTAVRSVGLTSHLSSNEEIINSVLRGVIELHHDKLPESSLMKVLTSVYLDAKSKLEANVPQDLIHQDLACTSKSTLNAPLDSKMSNLDNGSNSFRMLSDKNEQLREDDKAESEHAVACDLWHESSNLLNIPNFRKQEALDVLSTSGVGFLTSESHLKPTENLKPSFNSSKDSRTDNVPALTPMAFGSGQDAHLLKQEESRRQWKAALDEQLKEQQLLRGKHLEVRKENEFDRFRSGSFAPNVEHCNNSPAFSQANTSNSLFNNALVSHPSASHFMSSSFFLPDSTVTNDLHSSPGTNDMSSLPWKIGFNRVRGFTQQLYTDSVESAQRARLAYEARLINLKQIEEKRRQKEEEKAKLLMEEKLEEERISRERLRLQQMAEVENARKRAKDMEEFQRTQYLYESLVRAQEEAKLTKTRKHPYCSELKQNDGLKAVAQSEVQVSCRSTVSLENQDVNNPLHTYLFSTGCHVPSSSSINDKNYSVVSSKNSLAVQTSFPENISVQTENIECATSEDKILSNNNKDSKNRNKDTIAWKLAPIDKKPTKNDHGKIRVSVSSQQKQKSQKNFPVLSGKTTNSNSVSHKIEASQVLKAKKTSQFQSFNPDALNDCYKFNSANTHSNISTTYSSSAQTMNSHTGANKFARYSLLGDLLLLFILLAVS